MDALYRMFVPKGGLVFDIGAHVGDRVGSFRRLGARVVAVEPQPGAFRALRLIYARDLQVTLISAGVGARPGKMQLHLNTANPTTSTGSQALIGAAAQSMAWHDQTWDAEIVVEVTTLDALVSRFGQPEFVKIDVEGWEAHVLAGLSHPLPRLSFEITTIQRDVALDALARISQLGSYRFRLALGESQRFESAGWEEQTAMAARIASLPDAANSGDVYAVRADCLPRP
ncbi:MAG: FkbM family methyltransferase [Pseudomonadota bacterium]